MSERRSWDIAPRRSASAAPASPRATRRVEMTRASSPRQPAKARPVRTPPKERAPRPSTLRTKRKQERKRAWIGLLALFLVLLGAIVFVLWLPALRVTAVEAEGPDPDGIRAVAEDALAGNAFLMLPRNSIFLIPEKDIRARVLDAYPQVQAVSISATGLTTLKVKALNRSNAFVWCGESISQPAVSCYQADAEGLVYAPHQATVTSTATSTSELLVYGPLDGEGDSPIRAHVTYASALPGALKFIKAMRGLGADIASAT